MAILKCSMSIMPKLSGTGRIIIVTVLVSCPALPLAKLSLIQGLLCTFPLPFAFTAYMHSLPWPASFFLHFSNIFRAEKGSGRVPRPQAVDEKADWFEMAGPGHKGNENPSSHHGKKP